MTKRLLFCAALAFAMGQMAFASAPELFLSTNAGATTHTAIGAAGSVVYTNANFGGWNITVIAGTSNSPSLLPVGLDIASLSAECVVASCTALTAELSDQNFTQPVVLGGFKTFFSATLAGAASATQTAWDDPNNAFFGTTHLIGTVGPLTTPGGSGTASGGGPESGAPYSLTIQDVFAGCNGAACATYSTDGNITGVPEPAAVMLFGTLLALCASKFRRQARNNT